MENGQGALESMVNNVFAGRTVFVTGHTGFKGSWLSLWLHMLGAKVVGYALPPNTTPNLYTQLGLSRFIDSNKGDVRDRSRLLKIMRRAKPHFVFHLAAQPLVRLSYEKPVDTFAANVMGTVNLLEAVRQTNSVKVCQVITSDKCYENREAKIAYKETDRLGGHDPYSASKACAELVVTSYRNSFFSSGVSLSSARAGNVIGGGDWSKDRLFPDCMRALMAGKPVLIRNPRAVRPWQFVLEPLSGYLLLASRQWADPKRYAEAWNFGPREKKTFTTAEIADLVIQAWGRGRWVGPKEKKKAPHEAGLLQVDSAKARLYLKWKPVYSVTEAVLKTMAWYHAAQGKKFDALAFSRRQITEYAS